MSSSSSTTTTTTTNANAPSPGSSSSSITVNSIPANFTCSITGGTFVDPVIADDGHTYERTAISRWLRDHDTSPLTNKNLRSKKLVPNHTLQSIIAAWKEQGYQHQAEHANFKNLIEAPQIDAQMTMSTRFPLPRYIVCDQHKSESRFLISMLNPSVTHNSMDGGHGQAIFTDDVSLRVFMEHLISLAVQA